MRQVIIVSLDNKAYQVDEHAYSALRHYLDRAKNGLRNNPDVDEILADIERSIAEKCAAFLTEGKNVVSSENMAQILSEMGPVEEPAEGPEAPPPPVPDVEGPRRLYKRREGAVLDGICNGLAEYLGIDVVIVRVLFVVFSFVSGVGILAYIILAFAMPEDKTPQAGAPAPKPIFSSDFRKAAAVTAGVILVVLGYAFFVIGFRASRLGGYGFPFPFGLGMIEFLVLLLPFSFLAIVVGAAVWLVRRTTAR